MLVSKTDFSITKNYDNRLVDPELMSLGNEIRNKLIETRQAVIDISGTKDISGPHIQLMRASSTIRNPYVDRWVNILHTSLFIWTKTDNFVVLLSIASTLYKQRS